jgi:hypothetical protein
MKSMSRSHEEKWFKLRKLGRRNFVLYYGVLGWGVSSAILFALLQGYFYGFSALLFYLVASLILFPIGGYAWGRFMWWFFEKWHGTPASTKTS